MDTYDGRLEDLMQRIPAHLATLLLRCVTPPPEDSTEAHQRRLRLLADLEAVHKILGGVLADLADIRARPYAEAKRAVQQYEEALLQAQALLAPWVALLPSAAEEEHAAVQIVAHCLLRVAYMVQGELVFVRHEIVWDAVTGWRAWLAALGKKVRRAVGWGNGLHWAPWSGRAPPRMPLTVPCIVQRK
jgi:hypothetical protein